MSNFQINNSAYTTIRVDIGDYKGSICNWAV